MTDRKAYILFGLILLLTSTLVNPYLRGDGVGYYAYLRSIIIDGDLDFRNEFLRGDPAFFTHAVRDGEIARDRISPTGYIRNEYSIGPAILWAPFFLAAHLSIALARTFGASIPQDGYSKPYLVSCALGTILYGFLGLILSYWIARQYFPSRIATAATLGIWFASSLPVYMYFLPFMSHAHSVFAVALFLWYWIRTRTHRTSWRWFTLGAMAGLMVETYYLNAVLLFVPASESLDLYRKSVHERSSWGPIFQGYVLFGLGALIALLPHFIIKQILHGSPWKTGYGARWNWTSPQIFQVFFSSEHGLVSWTPLVGLAVVGLFLLLRKDRQLAAGLLLSFAALLYVVGSWVTWHGISSFGNRFFISLTPGFVIGLAAVIESVAAFLSFRIISIVLGLFALWNLMFAFQWGSNLIPHRGPVSWRQVVYNQFAVVPSKIASGLIEYYTDRDAYRRRIEHADLAEVEKRSKSR